MTNLELVKKVFKELNEGHFLIDQYGVFKETRKVINGEMHFYSSNVDFLNIIVLSFLNSKINITSFLGENINLNLKDLEDFFGAYQSGYNFRDNQTQFFFSELKNKKLVEELILDAEGNIAEDFDRKFNNFSFKLF
jgi:hypothetical protein